jgi:hypothetical protein
VQVVVGYGSPRRVVIQADGHTETLAVQGKKIKVE